MKRLYCSAALLFAVGCAGEREGSADSAAASTDQATAAAMVSNAIAANPTKADSILQANGYTTESFQRAMYDIAADSAMSERYAAAKAP
jgi:hypothetical protein